MHAVIKPLKTGKARGENDVKPEMLKAMNVYAVRWLTRVFEEAPTQKQVNVVIPKRKCTTCRGSSPINVLSKVYAKCLEKKRREIVEPKLTDAHCSV